MIGLIIAMVIAGALLAGIVPMFLSKHTQSKRGSDIQALEAAKTALVSYALSAGKLPSPVDASGNIVAAGNACDASGIPVPIGTAGSTACMMPASIGALAVLGVNNWGVYGKTNAFRMDVNDALLNTTSPILLCREAQIQLHAGGALPGICPDTSSVNAACSTAAASMAFVLYSNGEDHKPNLKNLVTSLATSRIYESGNRGIDDSSDEPLPAPPHHYDDQLVSYPLSSLVGACANAGLLPAPPVCTPTANPSAIAFGGTSTLAANCSNSPTSYSWASSNANPAPVGNVAGGVVSPAATTTYTVTASNATGSSAPASVTVTVLSASVPVCTISPVSATLALGATVQSFSASCTNPPITSHAWTLDGATYGGNASLINTPINLGVGVHPVTVAAGNATGIGPTATATLTVTPCVSGSTYLAVTNSSNGLASFMTGASCTSNLAVGATVVPGCLAGTTSVIVYNSKNCTGQGMPFNPLSAADSSGDGEAHITILQPASSSTTH